MEVIIRLSREEAIAVRDAIDSASVTEPLLADVFYRLERSLDPEGVE